MRAGTIPLGFGRCQAGRLAAAAAQASEGENVIHAVVEQVHFLGDCVEADL
jgi:hypothetical protein